MHLVIKMNNTRPCKLVDFTNVDLTKFNLIQDINCTSIPSYLATEANPVVQQTLNFPEIKTWLNDLTDLLLKIKLETKYDSFYKSTIEAFLIRFCR
jgi:hypothetical protein